MKTDKNLSQEMRRWLRVGTLTLTALGPIINSLSMRWRDQAERPATPTKEYSDPQERLLVIGTALSDVLAELRTHPYRQELVKRGEDLTGELMKQARKLSHLVERSGESASHKLLKNGQKVTKSWSKRGKRMARDLQKRNRYQAREQSKRKNMFWSAFAFSAGLTAAGIAIYLYIRQRLRQQEIDENQPIELSQNGRRSGETLRGQQATDSSRSPGYAAPGRQTQATMTSTEQLVDQLIPDDATVVGIVRTRLYYPVEMSLDLLTTPEEEVDVVYFVSEDEAQAQGFRAAKAK